MRGEKEAEQDEDRLTVEAEVVRTVSMGSAVDTGSISGKSEVIFYNKKLLSKMSQRSTSGYRL